MREPVFPAFDPRAPKRAFFGESKIEQGLLSFFLYRAAPPRSLLTVRPLPLAAEPRPSDALLNRALFFTTQKNMALEYAGEGTLLARIRGFDFLEDLVAADPFLPVILLDHEDVGEYERLYRARHQDRFAVERFFARHTYEAGRIPLRRLRRAAEVIVLLPEGMDRLPFERRHVHLVAASERRGRPSFSGAFHAIQRSVNDDRHGKRAPREQLERLRRAQGRLEAQAMPPDSLGVLSGKTLASSASARRSQGIAREIPEVSRAFDHFPVPLRGEKREQRSVVRRQAIEESRRA